MPGALPDPGIIDGQNRQIVVGIPACFFIKHFDDGFDALGGRIRTMDFHQLNKTFDAKLSSVGQRAYVDFALWVTCKPEDLSHIVPLKEKGAIGYKLETTCAR